MEQSASGRRGVEADEARAGEVDYSSFYVTTGMGNTGCLVAQDLALLTKVRTFIHEEISLLTVLYFPFRERTPNSKKHTLGSRYAAPRCVETT